MEAWEELALELPPGWTLKLLWWARCEGDNEPLFSAMDARGGEVYRGTREQCERRAWDAFGTPRKCHAELIAVERVREVAESSGWALIAVHMEAPRLAFIVDNGQRTVSHGGPTLCDAAWACIQALGGGE